MNFRFFDRPGPSTPHVPTRTCVGCRQRMPASALLRTTILRREASEVLVLDFGRRLGGRGAWVCPKPACVLAAGRKKAFARALRHPGPVDCSAVLDEVAALAEQTS
ncbi:MAG: YlxR family protein [Segniliparus sp.]|uniref:YlxR family protein n=1 Tax=Segniliparus sp. TaxID=2804064 RepID=UPI003F2E9F1F